MKQSDRKCQLCIVSLFLLVIADQASAALTVFTNKAAWEAAVGEFTTVGFADLPIGAIVTEQYADQGVHFTDGNDWVIGPDFFTYPQDGAGLFGGGANINLTFDTPQFWIAVDHPGLLMIEVFSAGDSVGGTLTFGGGVGNFLGVLSDIAFDAALLRDFTGDVFIDDLHFGPPIPAPGAVIAIALASLSLPQRRRR